jgi:predicted RNase H-like HicB family nuclease
MFSEYVRLAMACAVYQALPEDGSVLGEIPGFTGVNARAETLIDCRQELMEVLEEWIFYRVSRHLPVPEINGVQLPVKDDL